MNEELEQPQEELDEKTSKLAWFKQTAGPNELENSENEAGKVAGFWLGLWHGLIAPVAFVLSLFKDNIGIYEAHNNGRRYNFGFILGLMMVFGGNSGAGKKVVIQKDD